MHVGVMAFLGFYCGHLLCIRASNENQCPFYGLRTVALSVVTPSGTLTWSYGTFRFCCIVISGLDWSLTSSFGYGAEWSWQLLIL